MKKVTVYVAQFEINSVSTVRKYSLKIRFVRTYYGASNFVFLWDAASVLRSLALYSKRMILTEGITTSIPVWLLVGG